MRSTKKIVIDANKHVQESNIEAIAKKLNSLLSQHSVSTKTLSEATDISIAAINNLKRGEGNPTIGTLNAICHFFEISLVELLGLNNVNMNIQATTVPLYELRFAHNRRDETVENKILIEMPKNTDANSIFGIVINNNSFLPLYEKGTIFILTSTQSAADGDIVFTRIQNNINSIKRLFIKKNGFYLKNINLDESVESYKKQDIDILGVVIQIIQKTI